jgi:SAM-dependent methyltransferase
MDVQKEDDVRLIGPFSNVQEQINHFFPSDTHPYRVLDRKIAAEVRRDSTVLEIGCGRTAPCLQKLRGRAGTLYGIDLVEFSVLDDDLILLNEDVTDMKSIAANAIDLSFSRSVMEHVEDVDGAYREIFRVLKPGGKYIFLTPNRYDYASIIASLVPNRFHSRIVRHTEGREEIDTFPTFYRSNSFTKIRELSNAAGFEVLELARLGQYPAYLQFSRALFWLGCLYEKGLERSIALDCLKGWLICVLRKPSRHTSSDG